MNMNKLIIKLKSINIYDYAIRKFDYKRVNNEFLIIVSNILHDFRFYIPFRKM